MRPPEYPKNGGSVEKTVREIIDYVKATAITSATGALLKQSRRGTTLAVPKIQVMPVSQQKLVPFWPTLRWTEAGGYTLDMVDGNVILRLNSYGIDAVKTIQPTNIPDGLAVVDGDKITCRIQEDDEGKFTTATIIKTSGAWPSSTAPELVGGDNTTGVGGSRHIRLCEVLTIDGQVQLDVESTGHVDHFQPSLIDNTVNSAYTSGDGGRVLKEFEPNTGTWKLREIVAGSGVTITETADIITLEADGGGSITVKDEGVPLATAATILDFVGNGVTATGALGEKTITIPGIPAGSQGDILYFDAALANDWVVLTKPAVPAGGGTPTQINILTHDGVVPAWKLKEIESISVCISGTPTSWDIIKL